MITYFITKLHKIHLFFLAREVLSISISRHVDPDEGSLKGEEKVVTVPLVTGAGRGGTHTVAKYLNDVGVKAIHEGIAPDTVSVSWPLAPFTDRSYRLPEIQAPFSKIEREGWKSGQWHSKTSPLNYVNPSLREKHNLKAPVRLQFSPIVQLVREPLHSIASLARCFCGSGSFSATPFARANDERGWNFARRFLPKDLNITSGTSRTVMAANYWLGWFELVHDRAIVTLRIENATGDDLLNALGKEHNGTLPILQQTRAGESGQAERMSETLTWAELQTEIGLSLCKDIRQTAEHVGYTYDEDACKPTAPAPLSAKARPRRHRRR